MKKRELEIKLIEDQALTAAERQEILELCNRAFQEELGPAFEIFVEPTYVIGRLGDRIVSHALWITRWLEVGDGLGLRTAYVEMVATEAQFQGRGYASAIMKELVGAITDFDLAALCPATPELYLKLGWVFWRGPLYIRQSEGLLATPEEEVMILRLPKTPPLDLKAPLSAEWREGELW